MTRRQVSIGCARSHLHQRVHVLVPGAQSLHFGVEGVVVLPKAPLLVGARGRVGRLQRELAKDRIVAPLNPGAASFDKLLDELWLNIDSKEPAVGRLKISVFNDGIHPLIILRLTLSPFPRVPIGLHYTPALLMFVVLETPQSVAWLRSTVAPATKMWNVCESLSQGETGPSVAGRRPFLV